MLALIIFPFSIKPLISDRNNFNDKETLKFLHNRKKAVYEMLIATIKL
jgi:hypothetical protein